MTKIIYYDYNNMASIFHNYVVKQRIYEKTFI